MLTALLLAALSAAPADQRTVARLELAAPHASRFLLRACVPIPKGVFPRADLRSPFRVRLPGQSERIVPAQAEIVSRYPGGDADVVEIAAVAELDPRVRPGARITCALIVDDAPADPPSAGPRVPDSVAALLDPGARGRVALRTRDVFGNLYAAELAGNPAGAGFGSFRVLKRGALFEEERAYATLVPVSTQGATGAPLPHLMGVHAYWTTSTVDATVALALRVNNGAIAGNRAPTVLEETLGCVYWTSLELVLPKGWTAISEVPDPFLGAGYDEGEHRIVPLVSALPGGALHMMGPQAQFERRLILAPSALEDVARARQPFDGLAFPVPGEGLWSWSNPRTARYFPQRTLLASIDFLKRGEHSGRAAARSADADALLEFRAGLTTGTARGYYVEAGVMGWAHPWFIADQGGVGGEGIATVEGHYAAQGASQDGVEVLALMHRMNVCRQPEATYDAQGDIVGYERWLGADGKIPFDYRTNGGVVIPAFRLPMRYGPPPSLQVLEVAKRGLRPYYDKGNPCEQEGSLPYDGALLAWWPHDDQHLVRYTKNAKALVWLANDSLAKDDLMLSAELFHLSFHGSEHVPADWSAGMTLRVFEDIARKFPHAGLPLGREHAWGIDAMCAAYSVASPEWRARKRAWFDRVAQLFDAGAMPSGLLQRSVNERFLGHTRYCAAQCFECLFLMHAMRCMAESVYRDVDEPRRALLGALAVRAGEYLLFGPPWQRIASDWQPDPDHPSVYFQGPRQGIAVALNDERATPVFSDATRFGPNYLPPDGLGGGVEIVTIWPALDYLADWTQASAGAGLENRYLKRALDCWTPHASFRDLLRSFEEQAADPASDNSVHWIGLAGRLQSLGVR